MWNVCNWWAGDDWCVQICEFFQHVRFPLWVLFLFHAEGHANISL